MLKIFTDKNTNQSIAINNTEVKYIRETPQGTKVFFDTNTYVIVREQYLEVISNLNSK